MTEKEYVPVRDVMKSDVETIDGLMTVSEAAEHMRAKKIGNLIVERRGEFDEYGLLSVRDIANKVIEPDRAPARTNVYEIMTKPVLSLDAQMNIRYAIRQLTQFNLHRALVLDQGKAVGVVTLRDMVLRYLQYHH